MTTCAECGHSRQVDEDGLVEAHSALIIDYEVQRVTRVQCGGGGAPPASEKEPEATGQGALFDL